MPLGGDPEDLWEWEQKGIFFSLFNFPPIDTREHLATGFPSYEKSQCLGAFLQSNSDGYL